MSHIGITGIPSETREQTEEQELHMRGVNTLADGLTIRDEKIVEWEQAYHKLQNACNLLFEHLRLHMGEEEIEELKNKIRMQGVEVL